MSERTNPLRWEDFTPKERTGITREISRIGKQTRSGAEESVAKLRAAGEKGESDYSRMAANKADRVAAASKGFKNKPITMKGAIGRRQEAFGRAIGYARETGESLPGAGWYIEHSDEIHEARGNIPFRNAAAASAAMSPGKDPKTDEIPAFRELARLHNESHSITVGDEEYANLRHMNADQLANIVTRAASGEEGITSTSETLSHAGRPHERMTAKGIRAIRGEIPHSTANDPMSGPKTSSYYHSIADAGEMTNEERIDYESIARHVVHGDPNQGMFMFSKSEPGEIRQDSLLSPEHDTAEDTWMQAITSGQELAMRNPETGRILSPAKRAVDKGAPGSMDQFSKVNAGLPRDASITKQGAVHAFNNKATREAARGMGSVSFNQHGEEIYIPSVMMQEVSWTQTRRDAGGDADFNQAQKAKEDEAKRSAAETKRAQKQREIDEPRLPGFSSL